MSQYPPFRTILVNFGRPGTMLNLLEDLIDEQIAEMLPARIAKIASDNDGDRHA